VLASFSFSLEKYIHEKNTDRHIMLLMIAATAETWMHKLVWAYIANRIGDGGVWLCRILLLPDYEVYYYVPTGSSLLRRWLNGFL